MIEIPNFVSWFESAKTAGLERDVANAMVSAGISGYITGLWRSGDSKWAGIIGEDRALKDAATAMYLSLRELEKKNFLVLTIPQDMLAASNLSKFQTERQT